MSAKILTVIVPSYNMEKYLPKCLGSLIVAPELMEKLEVLVVNDGSKDRTSEIAHEFEAKYPQTFRVIDKANGHYGSCINAALPEVSGWYVKILDADDYVVTESFGKLITRVIAESANDVDLIFSDFCYVNPEGDRTGLYQFGCAADRIITLNEVEKFIFMHAIVHRTENLRKMGYRQTEGVPYTDTEWTLLPLKLVRKVVYVPEIVTCYMVGREGQTTDPNVLKRDVDKIKNVAERIVRRMLPEMDICATESVGYIWTWVKAHALIVYQTLTVGFCCGYSKVDGKDFDEFIRSTSPKMYEELDCIEIKTRIRFRYVHEWRRNCSRRTLRFKAFYLYCWLYKLYARCVRLIRR